MSNQTSQKQSNNRRVGSSRGPQSKHSASKFKNPVISPALTWMCTECKFILGYTDSAREKLRIKFKDQYITITKAEEIQCVCRRCGQMNSVCALSE